MAGNQMVVLQHSLTETSDFVYSATTDPDFNTKQMAICYFISLKFPIIVLFYKVLNHG